MKKKTIISYKNLSDELKNAVKKNYPLGYQDSMLRIDKGPNDFFYVIPLETEDVSYLIKVDVKIDDNSEEEEDKGYYNDDDEIKGADEIADSSDDEE